MLSTIHPGALIVQSAYPDPPFELMRDGAATGFDIELMRAICTRLGLELRPVAFLGDDFNDIFKGLIQGACDAVISGATITPDRAAIVRFSEAYLTFNQGIAVNRRITPQVASFADLRGLTAGNPIGKYLRFGRAATLGAGRHRRHTLLSLPRHRDGDRGFAGGTLGLVIKLNPVISWLIKDWSDLAVALQAPTGEHLEIAFAPDRADLCEAVDAAIRELRATGEFARLQAKWPGTEGSL